MKKILMNILYIIAIITSYPVQLIYFKRKVYYENKKTSSRKIKLGALIVSNHKAIIDFMNYMFLFPFRKVYCLMSELIYRANHFVLDTLGGIRVDRSSFDLGFIGKSVSLLQHKKLVLIFPESKLPTKNRMNEFKTSYILIALKGNVPIIPVYTDGRYGLFKRCHVIIGEKIYLSDYCQSENPSKEQIEYLNQIVTKKIVSLGKLMEQKMNKDKYNKLFSFKGFIKDIGRVIVFTMNLHFRVKVTTKNHQKLKIKGGRIIVANHISFFDPLVLIIALFRRRIYILTAEVVYDHHPIRAKFLNSIGCIRIDRNKHDFDAIKKCIDIASSGGVILIFPSGHLNFKNEIDEFKSGASLIATQANVPLTCAYIERFKHHFHHYYVHFGDTIYLDQQDTYSLKMIDDISQRLFNNMKQLEYNVKEVNK